MFDLPLEDLPLDNPLLDNACRPDPIVFENADWRVAEDGLEHRESGYFIARNAIAMRRGDLWEWPMHLAEKTWCTPRSFREAFLAAIHAFGLESDSNLSQSFAVAFGLVTHGGKGRGDAGFVSLGDLVRPKAASAGTARKRNPAGESRLASRRIGATLEQRAGETARQRVAL